MFLNIKDGKNGKRTGGESLYIQGLCGSDGEQVQV